MKKHIALVASFFALTAVPALADTHDHDAEHDFPLSMESFMDAHPEVTPEAFFLIDTDGDGEVSEEEYDAAREAGLITDTEAMDAD
ncbi:hypothetical protein [Roseinatronobacter bogoriensis]|uniref:EF-hand domain-containing protein n=1 Tax=Roseinatronobacter bogoriensis subsp. barguzinensis TaxID=441209 RepID=A0A2K8K5E3_9RHOB|nr:hypothetical protein [Rhodobaca]ATX64674.1 hypothetical protein BG454_01530 [Rhodobaca barguzinensis]MBB4209486.1 hypothetical protein [Rhodobaca bogoriensis DSM 18756]TDW35148.1 hypothetical protein LY39_03241 [Rhodobaca barguzinensis]TDY66842.1 hypothetical protein EV660_10968 [Rhodobaca bogoriensis DSM 18756]